MLRTSITLLRASQHLSHLTSDLYALSSGALRIIGSLPHLEHLTVFHELVVRKSDQLFYHAQALLVGKTCHIHQPSTLYPNPISGMLASEHKWN